MKKLITVLSLCIALFAILSISVFAEDKNIASEASSAYKSNVDDWVTAPGYLIDGNRETGTGSWQKDRYTTITVKFDNEQIFTKLVLVVNGKGEVGTPSSYDNGFVFDTVTTFGYWFHVWILDADGKTLKDLGDYQSWNANENQEVIINLDYISGYQVAVRLDAQYNNKVGMWEMETYAHVACEFDNLKEITKAPTCIKDGLGVYECKCGKTVERPVYATGEHLYEKAISLKYENGYLEKGTKTMGCKYDECEATDVAYTPALFKFLGYSKNASGDKICAGYVINYEAISEYESINATTVEYGMVLGVNDTNPLASGAYIAKKQLNSNTNPRYDIVLTTSNWVGLEDIPLVMCMYVIDGSSTYYISSSVVTEEAIPIRYTFI